MGAAANSRAARGAALLLAHCALQDDHDRAPVLERLRAEIGPDLTRLLLVALSGDHRMRSRDLVAA